MSLALLRSTGGGVQDFNFRLPHNGARVDVPGAREAIGSCRA
jgi:hypothetical protein